MFAILLLAPLVYATTYPLVESCSGFRDDPSTYDNTTSGDVFWAGTQNTSLLYVNSAGRVIMKVDNSTVVPYNEKRYAPKLLSKTAYNIGTVWVLDAVHLPYGCSVWPAFWTQGANWPLGGEIDIIEGINLQTTDQIALHTNGNCLATSSSAITGTLTYNNCSIGANSDSGCTTNITNSNSYGSGFAAAGGGVYVTEFATTGIKVWFLTVSLASYCADAYRSAVPSSLSSSAKSIDTSSLGTPVASYDSSSCAISTYFTPQILTIDITLCGVWAGIASILEETCPALVGTNTCYTTYVINNASTTYQNAYFEINYINVYSTNSSSSNSTQPSGSPTTTNTATIGVSGSTTGTQTATGKSAGIKRWEQLSLPWVAAMVSSILGGVMLAL